MPHTPALTSLLCPPLHADAAAAEGARGPGCGEHAAQVHAGQASQADAGQPPHIPPPCGPRHPGKTLSLSAASLTACLKPRLSEILTHFSCNAAGLSQSLPVSLEVTDLTCNLCGSSSRRHSHGQLCMKSCMPDARACGCRSKLPRLQSRPWLPCLQNRQ